MLSYRSDESSKARNGQEAEGLGEFSLVRYEPMAHLLSEADLEFVKAQPGYRPEMGRAFRRNRRRIFRLYLRDLAADFRRLHARARAIVASLPSEHAAMVGSLIRLECRFWYEMAAVELRLFFDWTGVPAVNVRALVNAVASMQAEVGRLSAPALA